MNILINRQRLLSSLRFDPETFKGIKIGDLIQIPEEQAQYLVSNWVTVTGFNPEHNIVHWRMKSEFGGIAHSGSFYHDILDHVTFHNI